MEVKRIDSIYLTQSATEKEKEKAVVPEKEKVEIANIPAKTIPEPGKGSVIDIKI